MSSKCFETVLTLPAELDSAAQSQLESLGLEIDGKTLTLMSELANLEALISGLEITLPNLPLGEIKAVTQLQNAAGNTMGSLSYRFEFQKSDWEVAILLKPVSEEKTPNGCTALVAEVSGATLTSTAGGLLVEVPAAPDSETHCWRNPRPQHPIKINCQPI